MLTYRLETGPGEVITKELILKNNKLILAQANCQAVGSAQLQDISEMLNI